MSQNSRIILPNGRDRATKVDDAGERGTRTIVAKPVLACDLDGTLRYPQDGTEFINEPEQIAFFDGVLEAVWAYRDAGWLPVVVSNQAGVAHGHLSKKDLDRQMNRMKEIAREETPHGRGWPFLDTRFCMYDTRAEDPMYGYRSLNRKPGYGMLAGIENRAKANGVVPVWDQSVYIGDRPEDRRMAEAASVTFWPAEEWRAQVQEEYVE